MDLNLQPLATACFVSGERFAEGSRVVSLLVRNEQMEVARYDVLETQRGELAVEGTLVCSWVQPYKPRQKQENPDRALKMTAENLFLTLADPSNEPDAETVRLIQFLALMLERKRILRPKGTLKDDGGMLRARYEHAKSKQVFDVPQTDFSPEFFIAVQAQLSVLLGGGSEQASPNTEASGASETQDGNEKSSTAATIHNAAQNTEKLPLINAETLS